MNPFWTPRARVELVGLYRRQLFREREDGERGSGTTLARRLEPQPVFAPALRDLQLARPSPPLARELLSRLMRRARAALGRAARLGARWSGPPTSSTRSRAGSSRAAALFDLFMPFVWENRYVFRCDNIRALYARMTPADRSEASPGTRSASTGATTGSRCTCRGWRSGSSPAWRRSAKKRVHAVDAAPRPARAVRGRGRTHHRHRVAFRGWSGEREERFTYGELHRVRRPRGPLPRRRRACKPATGCCSSRENRPEWAIAFFGILRAGATVVPVDAQLSERRDRQPRPLAPGSRGRLLSEEAAHDLPGLWRTPSPPAALPARVVLLAEALAGDPRSPARRPVRVAAPDDVASLIFTSRHHRHAQGRDAHPPQLRRAGGRSSPASSTCGMGDGLLSVLPLHHTFEFTGGLLMPLSPRRGGDVPRRADRRHAGRRARDGARHRAWSACRRCGRCSTARSPRSCRRRPALVEQAIRGADASANARCANRPALNLGKLLFWPVHRKLGGRLRFLISGGSALPDRGAARPSTSSASTSTRATASPRRRRC